MRCGKDIRSDDQTRHEKTSEHTERIRLAQCCAGERTRGQRTDKHQRKIASDGQNRADRDRDRNAADPARKRRDHGKYQQKHDGERKADVIYLGHCQQEDPEKQADTDLFRIRQHMPVADRANRDHCALHGKGRKHRDPKADQSFEQRLHALCIKHRQHGRKRKKQQDELIDFCAAVAESFPQEMRYIKQRAACGRRKMHRSLEQQRPE